MHYYFGWICVVKSHLNSYSIPNVPTQSSEGPPHGPTIYVIELELGRLLAWQVNLFSDVFVLDFLKKKFLFFLKKIHFIILIVLVIDFKKNHF
jgi:hypothetical protein